MLGLERHKDTGCKYHPSCLERPEPVCIYELPDSDKRCKRTVDRNQAIRDEYQNSRKSHKEIADMFGVHARTVQRVLNVQEVY